ncbi:AraC family transcriptional regulator [Paenibacillus sp. CAA11]|nr:AraC family transcriptional regulator [Paenibacillus sp. CAA11]
MLPDMDSTFRIFAAHVRTVTKEWFYPKDRHPLFEVNLVLEGSQEMIVNGRRHVQQPGDLVLLRPEDVHESRVIGEQPMTYYCLHFDVDERVLRELLCHNEPRYCPSASPLAQKIRPSLDKLIALTSSSSMPKLADKMLILSAVFELFAGLSEILSSFADNAEGTRTIGVASEIAAALENSVKMQESLAGQEEQETSLKTIREITEQLGYSASSCNRMFHQVYGMSPRQYLSALKLKKAKLALMAPELSIEAISIRLGYKDIAHFSRQFKRWTGESPAKFRSRFHT